MTTASLSFCVAGQVQLRCQQPAIDEARPLEAEPPFGAWAREYVAAHYHPREDLRLLALGHDIAAWLDGRQRWLTRWMATAAAPLILEIEVPAAPGPVEQAALDAPWELIAMADRHLARDDRIRLSPVRRLDVAGLRRPPSRHRLSVLFMAAQPRDVAVLDFEREEAAIAAEVGRLGPDPFDLIVEESGTLDGLVAAAQRAAADSADGAHDPEGVDVVHITCHGSAPRGRTPVLWLEDDLGTRATTTAGELAGALAAHVPALAFISACSTAEASRVGRSFASELCARGWPATLGWSAPVDDGAATQLAARLYYRLAQRLSLVDALAWCRCEPIVAGARSRRAWHQARLVLGRGAGGVIAGGHAARRTARLGQRHYLDRGRRVPVAGDAEFVGRRRALQRVLASLQGRELVGAVIHGAGQLGKSSLAARVSRRRPDLRTIVIHRDYDAGAVLGAIAREVATAEAGEVVARHRPDGAAPWTAARFGWALRELLEGPCRTAGAGAMLLVVDDLEQVLVPPSATETHATACPRRAPPLAALIGAFHGARTASRLLFTSRYRFSAPDASDVDLACHLWHEPLAAMSREDLLKCVRAQRGGAAGEHAPSSEWLARGLAAIELCRGNPGLLRILLTLVDGAGWAAIAGELGGFVERGAAVSHGEVAQLIRAVLPHVLAMLDTTELGLVRMLAAFETHIPVVVASGLIVLVGPGPGARGPHAIERLISLGVIDLALSATSQPGLGAPAGGGGEVSVNPLVAPAVLAAATLDHAAARIARAALAPLRAAWDAAVRSRSLRECQELARLAAIAADLAVLAEVAGPVVTARAGTDVRAAAELAAEVEPCATLWPSVEELRMMAEACQTAGRPAVAGRLLARGLALGDSDPGAQARLQLTLACWHWPRGELSIAEALVVEAVRAFERLGDARSSVLAWGRLADLHMARGRLDEALAIHRDRELPVYGALGSARDEAVVQVKIAGILTMRGCYQEAIEMLDGTLAAYAIIGDLRSQAITWGKIADVERARGRLDVALAILEERELPAHERLGDARETALTRLRIATVYFMRGQLDDAMALLRRGVLPLFEEVGDVRNLAIAYGTIADIYHASGQLDLALQIWTERELVVYREIDDVRSAAVTLGKIAGVHAQRGAFAEALRIVVHQVVPVFEQLGDEHNLCIALANHAQLLLRQPTPGHIERARAGLFRSLAIAERLELPLAGSLRELLAMLD